MRLFACVSALILGLTASAAALPSDGRRPPTSSPPAGARYTATDVLVPSAPFSAAAARPVKGALYGGADEFGAVLYLGVSASGRWLNPRRSVINWAYGEHGDYSLPCGRVRLRLGSSRHPVRISHDGRFRFVRRRGAFVFRLRGRFLSKDRARVAVRYRREQPRCGRSGACDDSDARLVPRRIFPLEFDDCRTHEAQTLLSAPTGRVFREPRWWPGGRHQLAGWKETAYACLDGADGPVNLGVDEDIQRNGVDDDLSLFRLVGPYVAYLRYQDCGIFPCYTIYVRDLHSGRTTKRVRTGYVPDLELTSEGSVAWIDYGSPTDDTDTSVRASDSLGLRQLDSGNISNRLTLTDSTLTWRKDAAIRSAALY